MVEMKLSEIVTQLVKERGTSLKEIAKECGVPYQTLHKWVKEGRQPTDLVRVKRLANYFKVDLEYLLFGQSRRPPLEKEDFDQWKTLRGKFEVTIKRLED